MKLLFVGQLRISELNCNPFIQSVGQVGGGGGGGRGGGRNGGLGGGGGRGAVGSIEEGEKVGKQRTCHFTSPTTDQRSKI